MNIKHTFIYLTCLAMLLSACKSEEDEPPTNDNPFIIKPGSPALIVAHRGGRGLFPENTLVAFDGAVAMSVDVLEMDVCLTKDSVLVTIHDLAIDRTSDTVGNVIDFTYQELQAFNFGYNFQDSSGNYPYRNDPVRIPRLEDIFSQHPDELMVIEIKDQQANGRRAAEKLLALIRSFGMTEKVAAFSFSDEVMNHFHTLNSDSVLTGASFSDGFNFVSGVQVNPDTVLPIRVNVFAFPKALLGIDLTSDTIINAIHRHNAAIHYWTINDKDDMKALIQKGADGVITDRPDLMQQALSELGF